MLLWAPKHKSTWGDFELFGYVEHQIKDLNVKLEELNDMKELS